ncbi:MAG TPA: phosphohydrolase [Clostridiales bacterium]|nr:phosphohydrolase [Clostridiales bacterium]
MYIENEVSVFDFVLALSEAVDLASPELSNHHKKVAYIAYHIAREMRLSDEMEKDIALAALVHDIGAFSLAERLRIKGAVIDDVEIAGHAELGYKLLKDFSLLKAEAALIRYHHALWSGKNKEIPVGAYVLHLADRLAVQYDESADILEQVPAVMEKMEKQKKLFHPEAWAALLRLSKLEYFWIEAWRHPDEKLLPERIRRNKGVLNMEVMRGFAKVFAQVIDFRSRFTATHSSGVAAVARELSALEGFSAHECDMMEVAGFLHDLGKLAVPNDVLEKNGKLDHVEFSIMRKHTYYTYTILRRIKGMENIAGWAAFHHERMDGNGYPFHVKGERMHKLSRTMAVADVFTAITEDRPYRQGMDKEQTMKVLTSMVENGGLDGGIVNIVQENFDPINKTRHDKQQAALAAYEAVYQPDKG